MARARWTNPSFAEITPDERLRWSEGGVLIAGQYTPLEDGEPPQATVWPSWEAWATVYARVRAGFLAWHADRDVTVPGAGRLYAAFERDGAAGADAESAALAAEEREEQRRVYACLVGSSR